MQQIIPSRTKRENNKVSLEEQSAKKKKLTIHDKEVEQFVYLDPTDYVNWTREQVCSLLPLPEAKGGADLSGDDVISLYKANFKGTSIGNIVNRLKDKKDHAEIAEALHKNFPKVPLDTIDTIVFWVSNLLKTRFYQHWSNDDLKMQLCKQGGLTEDAIPLDIDGKKLMDTLKNVDEEPSHTINRLLDILYKSTKLEIKCCRLDIETIETARKKQGKMIINASPVMLFLGGEEIKITAMQLRVSEDGTLSNGKSRTPIPFFAGSPGIGKTRSAIEYAQLVKESSNTEPNLSEYLTNKVEIYLQLQRNGISFGRFECDKTDVDDTNYTLVMKLEEMITARLCYTFVKFFIGEEFAHLCNQQTILDFALFVKSCVGQPKLTIVVVIDEYQHLNQYRENVNNRSGLDLVVNIMGASCSAVAEHNILLLPIFSGLSRTKIENSIKGSTHPQLPLIPPRTLMSFKDFCFFIRHFIKTFDENAKALNITMNNYIVHPNLLKLWSNSFGSPKQVEHIINNLMNSQNWKAIEANPLVIPSINMQSSALDYIMALFLTRTPVNPSANIPHESNNFEYYEDQAHYKLVRNNESFLLEPFLPLTRLTYEGSIFKKFADLISEAVLNGGAYSLNGTQLENFNSQFLFAKSCGYRLLGKETIRFRDFFDGFLPSKTLENTILWNEGKIKLDTFNVKVMEGAKTDDHSQLGVHYVFSGTQNKKGCDRLTKVTIEYPDKSVYDTTILFQDRGMQYDLNLEKGLPYFSMCEVKEELLKNGFSEPNTKMETITLKNGATTSHPTQILVYMSTKHYSQPLEDSMVNIYPVVNTKENKKVGENMQPSAFPCMVLGNNANFQKFYGPIIYHGLYLVNIPRDISIQTCRSEEGL